MSPEKKKKKKKKNPKKKKKKKKTYYIVENAWAQKGAIDIKNTHGYIQNTAMHKKIFLMKTS